MLVGGCLKVAAGVMPDKSMFERGLSQVDEFSLLPQFCCPWQFVSWMVSFIVPPPSTLKLAAYFTSQVASFEHQSGLG